MHSPRISKSIVKFTVFFVQFCQRSKTVTWADDPQMNFKRDSDTMPSYDSNQPSDYQNVVDVGETSQIDKNQQSQQQQQLYQYENESYATEADAPIQYSVGDNANAELQQSASGDQGHNYYYDDGNYVESSNIASAGGATIDPATGVYYDQSGQQAYQDQYYYEDGQNPSQQQPSQQYAANDAQQV